MQQELFIVLKRIVELQEEILRLIKRLPVNTSKPQGEVWLDDADLLDRFNISRSTLYRLKKQNILKPYPLGGKVVYLEHEVVLALKESGNN